MDTIKKTVLATAAGAAAIFGASATASADNITVKAGDTLSQLAVDHNTTTNALASANKITDKDLILIGETLKVAKGSSKDDVAASKVVAAKPAETANTESAQPQAAVAQEAANTEDYSAGASSSIQVIVDAMNAKRAALGLSPVRYDASLAATAQARAEEGAANGGLPTGHFQQIAGPEVVAIGWNPSSVVDAWYNETNMYTNGTPSHRNWLTNASFTKVGFGISGDTIVGIAG
ncbi:CAP domain-containing protein [Eupransor demetentiae]|uniref:LysM repeat (LysM) n=1 Tax=Eupransor demetentiae TaxID=3109584 RepID=A0ABP0EQF3_9LACO|nr:LysM repeat (LysM) [Lactobacillaceae bacterium LMG 33000]